MNNRYPGTRKKCKLSACRNRAWIFALLFGNSPVSRPPSWLASIANWRFFAHFYLFQSQNFACMTRRNRHFSAHQCHFISNSMFLLLFVMSPSLLYKAFNLFLTNISKYISDCQPWRTLGANVTRRKKPGQKCNMKKCENSLDTVMLLHTYDYTSYNVRVCTYLVI
jgi:hypothetical protein